MALTNKRICITGGAGFIGSHLLSQLVEHNHVVVFDNLHRNALQFAHLEGHKNLTFIKGDVLDFADVRKAVEGCQIVIHCAAIAGVYTVDRSAVRTMEVNMLGTHQVVKAALEVGVERFVEFSTSEVYGSFIHKGKEDDFTPIGPIGESRWVYAASKLASEHLSYAHYREDKLPLAIVRPFNVYGPRQVGDGAIRGMTLQALRDLPITLYNDGTQIRSWCFVSDFCDGVLRCCENPAAIGHAFNIGNPQGTATNFELANLIIRLTNSKSEIVFKPHPGPEVELRVPAIDKAMTMLGYRPTVSLESGVKQASGLVSRELRRGGRKEVAEDIRDLLHAISCHRRVGIHRPQHSAARSARVDDRCRLPLDAGPRSVRQTARADQRQAGEVRPDVRRGSVRDGEDDWHEAGRDAVPRSERRSGGVVEAATLGSRVKHRRLREHARAVSRRSRGLRVVRARSMTDCAEKCRQ